MSCAKCAASVAGPAREEPVAARRHRPAQASGPIARRACDGCGGAAHDPARPGHPAHDLRPVAPGRALAPDARAWFERRLGHDLGAVRVHDDPASAATARGIGALAYTVGRDIAFAAGGYRPDSGDGRRLLAHELAHVVQQGAAPRLGNAGGAAPAAAVPQRMPELGPPGDAYEREAERVADAVAAGATAVPALRDPRAAAQAQPAPGGLFGDFRLRAPRIPPPPLIWPGSIREAWVVPDLPALPRLEPPTAPPTWRPRLLDSPTLSLDPRLRFTPVRIIPVPRRVPDRQLSWADFPSNSVPGNFGAETVFTHPRIVVDGNPMFQARLSNTSSVRPKFRNPSARASNGCAPRVASCQAALATPNSFWFSSRPAPDPCPAGVSPSCPRPSPCDPAVLPPCGDPDVECIVEAQGDCAAVFGPACDAAAIAESARLLAHEQLHFDIVWKLVGRANDALLAGTHSPGVLDTWLDTHITAQTRRYDSVPQTNHGCDAAGQASWTSDVASGLQSVALPPPDLTPPAAAPPPSVVPPTVAPPTPPPPISLVPPGPF